MPSHPEDHIPILDSREFLEALLAAPRPGTDKILAFYDSRADAICRDARNLLIPLDDHLCTRGDALFESFCCRENKIFAFGEHLARLRSGAEFLQITPPCSFGRIGELVQAVARAAGKSHAELRLFLGRGPGGFGISPAECPKSSLYIVCLDVPLPAASLYERGLSAFASKVPAKQPFLAHIKTTSYVLNVFMALETATRGEGVAIAFDGQGNMTESAIANVAIVDAAGNFRSPDPADILPGTTLLAAMRLAAAQMPVAQGPISLEDIKAAREMFILTSFSLCVAITSFNGLPIGSGKPGPVALWLKDALLQYMLSRGTPYR